MGGGASEAARPPAADGEQLLLLRYSGELSTKAKATRRQFVARLRQNLLDALASEGLDAEVEAARDRMWIHSGEASAFELARRVFGLQSVSRVECHEDASLEGVVAQGTRLFRDAVRDRRFAVRVRLVGGREGVPYRARELEAALGAELAPFASGVDLDHPEATARIEIYRGCAWFCLETCPGPGGLPLGSAGRALALVSGGFDSAVAAWQLLKRGVELDYLFCNLGGRSHELGTLRVMKVLAERWSYGSRPLLYAVDFEGVADALRCHTTPRYWQVLLKRCMLRAGEAIAEQRRAEALVTGEAIGQVSSQTLTNLASISEVTALPILRPLVGFNKEEIIALAEAIGTAPLSAVVQEYCSMVPRKPATAARVAVLQREEAGLDLAPLDKAVAQAEVLELRSLDLDQRGMPEIEIEELPAEALVIDLRSKREFESWHPPDALHLDFARALRAYASFDRGRSYVLYCEYGLKSAHLAELMRAEGFRAYNFRGGTRRLRRWCESRSPAG